jgi:hypothetical protein
VGWLQVESDVFPAAGAGPEGMAASFGVPFLGELVDHYHLAGECSRRRLNLTWRLSG